MKCATPPLSVSDQLSVLQACRHKLGSGFLTPTGKADSNRHLMLQHSCLYCTYTGRVGAEQHMEQLVPFIIYNYKCYHESSIEPSHQHVL